LLLWCRCGDTAVPRPQAVRPARRRRRDEHLYFNMAILVNQGSCRTSTSFTRTHRCTCTSPSGRFKLFGYTSAESNPGCLPPCARIEIASGWRLAMTFRATSSPITELSNNPFAKKTSRGNIPCFLSGNPVFLGQTCPAFWLRSFVRTRQRLLMVGHFGRLDKGQKKIKMPKTRYESANCKESPWPFRSATREGTLRVRRGRVHYPKKLALPGQADIVHTS